MQKQAIIGEALDNYVDLQARHPGVTMGVGLAAGLVPGVGTAMQLPNIAHSIRHGRNWDALGQTGQAALGLVPGLNTLSQIILPTAVGMGGNYMQQRADAAKAASYRDRLMSHTKLAHPALAAALPLLKTMGVQAALGAGMQGVSNLMNRQPMLEGTGHAAIGGGISGAMTHGANKLMGAGATSGAGATPPPEPKQAFAQRLKAAQAIVSPNQIQEKNMTTKQHNALLISAMTKMAAYPKLLEKMGVSDEEILAMRDPSPMGGPALTDDQIRAIPPTPGQPPMGEGTSGPKMKTELSDVRKGLVKDVGKRDLESATTGNRLGSMGLTGLAGGGIGAAVGGGVGALSGKPITGAMTGGGAGLGGTLGFQGGNLLRLLLKSKGYDVPESAMQYAGAGLGGLGGAGLGYALSPEEKRSNYHPRLLLSSLTNAARAGGQHMLPGPFPTAIR